MYLVLASWLISAFLASSTTPHGTVKIVCSISPNGGEIIDRIPKCFRDCKNCSIALYATDWLQFVIVLIVNIVLYSFITRKVTKIISPNGDIDLKKRVKKVVHGVVTMLIIVNGIVFFVCLTPFSIVNTNNLFGRYFGWFEWNQTIVTSLVWIWRILFLLNSVLNPLIYNATNSRYRLAFN